MGNFLYVEFAIHPKYVKILYYFLFSASIIILFYRTYMNGNHNMKPYKWYAAIINKTVQDHYHQDRKWKYMLIWTHPEDTPFVYFGQASSVFENKSCKWSNCYVTADRNYLSDYAKFDVIIFSSSRLSEILEAADIPRKWKYMLIWTHPEDTPFVYFGQASSVFENKSCKWSNCYVTADRNYLSDYAKFDVIIFSSSRLSEILEAADIPVIRSVHQKYVFASVESAAHYPICTHKLNGFFNWTWTYKLNSDAMWGYINIRNATGYSIGPKQEMHWIETTNMEEIDDDLRFKLRSKYRVAAWFVSNCDTLSLREELVKEIDFELNKYEVSVDIYGSCGKFYCAKKIMNHCFKILEKDYFFYFAFENSFSEDYVTEKLMYALQHNTVPVVYGGANYTRFLPNGSYLDARQIGPAKLAQKMIELSNDPIAYAQYFKWKKYYSYHYRHESPDTDDYCRFCAMLNDDKLVKNEGYYSDIKIWWSGNMTCAR